MAGGVSPAGVSRQAFVGAEIVHPAIGVRIAKAKGPDRTAIPDRMIRLHRMWQVSLGAQMFSTLAAFATALWRKTVMAGHAQYAS